MTRCIQCTRCVRFMTEIAGIEGVTLYPESWVGWTRAKGELAQRK